MKITFKSLPLLVILFLFVQVAFAQSLCTPIAMNDQLGSVDNNRTLTFSLAALTGNDAQTLELESFSQPTSGFLTYNDSTKLFSYTPAAGFSGTISFNYSLKRAIETRLGMPLIVNGEEHYYEQIQVPASITWQDAMMQAAGKSYNGNVGYLATVTTAAENELIRQMITVNQLGNRTWLGGSDAAEEGTWRWVTGPEAGMLISSSNWGPNEPNNIGEEDYLAMELDGRWNDLSNSPEGGYKSYVYIVEYGSSENCEAGLTATASLTVNEPVEQGGGGTCDLALTTTTMQAEPWWPMWGVMNGAGSIDLTVMGGTAPYTYKWNAGLTSQDVPAASPGRYMVTVTDATGCTATTTVYVGVKDKAMVLTTAHINASAPGASDGSVNLSVIGGTGPYTFMWSNGATTEDLTGLAAGSYMVNVMDAMGQKATTTVYVSQPGMPLNALISHQNVTQQGGYGSINLTPIGGVGPYSFKWNAGAVTEDLPQVTPGLYSVTITDATGATFSTSVQVMGYMAARMAGGKNPAPGREVSLNPVVTAGLVAYPNPVKNRATIAFNMAEAGTYKLDLYDVRGALVKQIGQGQANREQQISFELDAATQAKGIYILKLVTDQGISSKRIVIEP